MRSYRLPFCLCSLSLKLGHLFTVVDWHQHLPHSQQDQADTHNRKGDSQNNHGDVRRLWAAYDRDRGWDETEPELPFASSVFRVVIKLTVHLEIVGSGPCLTSHHIKRNPALILRHQCALHRGALVIIWEEMWTYISIRRGWIHSISSSLWHCAENVKGYPALCCAVGVISISKTTIWCVCMCVSGPHHCISHLKPENPLW